MHSRRHWVVGTGLFVAMPFCVLLIAGCSKPAQTTDASPEPPSGGPTAGPGGGPGGMPGGRGGRGGPVAENASGPEIYQAKCGCHGPGGKGGRAPVLTSLGNRSDDSLYTIIHDGRQRMPAFGTQLTEAQIKKVVTYLKQLSSG